MPIYKVVVNSLWYAVEAEDVREVVEKFNGDSEIEEITQTPYSKLIPKKED